MLSEITDVETIAVGNRIRDLHRECGTTATDGCGTGMSLIRPCFKWIKRITADSLEFEDGEAPDMKNLDWKRIKPLIWW